MQEIQYDLNLYDYEIINNNLIIKKKEVELNREEFLNADLTHSTIIYVKLDNDDNLPLSYKGILNKIMRRLTARRFKNISLFRTRIRDGEYHDNGYYYIEELNISYIGLSANDCKREIINIIDNLDINFEIKIYHNNRIIIFRNN